MNSNVSVRIVEEVASAHGTDPSNLDFAVGEYVDLEAVDRLVTRSTGLDELRFRVPDYEVVVTGPESISVEPVQSATATHTE